jgi:hypothetical protein
LKEEALDCTMWRNRFGRGFGPVVRQNTEWMNVDSLTVGLVLHFSFILHVPSNTLHVNLKTFV